MKRNLLKTLVVAAAAYALVGCGGVGSSYRGPTPLAGGYTGIWITSSSDSIGTLTITFNNDSTYVGTVKDLVTGETGIASGEVDLAQHFNGDFNFSDGRTAHLDGNIGGPVAKAISGNATFAQNGNTQAMTFLAAEKAASPYSGAYHSTYTTVNGSHGGNLDFIIDQQGLVTGTYTDTVTGVNGALDGGNFQDGEFQTAFIQQDGNRRVLVGSIVVLDGGSLFELSGYLRSADGSRSKVSSAGSFKPQIVG